jgi:hypothetical protein
MIAFAVHGEFVERFSNVMPGDVGNELAVLVEKLDCRL